MREEELTAVRVESDHVKVVEVVRVHGMRGVMRSVSIDATKIILDAAVAAPVQRHLLHRRWRRSIALSLLLPPELMLLLDADEV